MWGTGISPLLGPQARGTGVGVKLCLLPNPCPRCVAKLTPKGSYGKGLNKRIWFK